jgi:hypothetical protein
MNKPSNMLKVAVVGGEGIGPEVLSALIWRLQACLLRWQRHNMAD